MNIVDPPTKQLDTEPASVGRISHDLKSKVGHLRLNLQTGALESIPEPSSSAELDQWLKSIELSLKDGGIPRSEWPDAAILFLGKDGNLNRAMRSLRQSRFREGFSMWTWEEFIAELRTLLGKLVSHMNSHLC